MKVLLNENVKKNRNIDLAYVSEHCTSFGTKISIWPLLRSGENCMGAASRSLRKSRYLQLVWNISWNFGNTIFVSFRSRHGVK